MASADFLPALPWLAPFATLARLADSRPNLSDVTPASGELVSVIVPARNEASTIETIVGSVLGSAYRPLELLVVDDRSTPLRSSGDLPPKTAESAWCRA